MLHNYLKLDLTGKYKFNITFKFMYVKAGWNTTNLNIFLETFLRSKYTYQILVRLKIIVFVSARQNSKYASAKK